MPLISRELAVTQMGRMNASTDRTTLTNILLAFLRDNGFSDVADAYLEASDRTTLVAKASMDQGIITDVKNRKFSARSVHDRV